MIIGLIPVGGKGTRLSLPYSKEMLPQKNYDYFNPIINHLVQKMTLAGAEKICFVHGSEFKNDILNYFDQPSHVHILQENTGFANVIRDFHEKVDYEENDKIIFGLPDSVFDKNIFISMIHQQGIVCGLFTTNRHSKVDRLDVDKSKFQVKTEKTEQNLDWFWGTIKFDGSDIKQMVSNGMFDTYKEIGDILNQYKISFVYGENYLDLGTWANYNRYLTSNNNFSNVEIEKKYDARLVSIEDFNQLFSQQDCKFEHITSTDYYYTLDNPNIEFLRYRESSDDEGAIPDLTVKNFSQSQFNRFELTVPLSKEADTHDVLYMLNLIGAKFFFSVTKECFIYKFNDYTVVMYQFDVNKTNFKIIEIELNTIDFNHITRLEETLSNIKGFDPTKTITESKFQIIRKLLHDTP